MAEPLTSFTGVSSGLDWRSLVDQMMKAERRPADRLQTTIAENGRRKEALNAFQAQLTTLQDAAAALAGRASGASSSPFESFLVTSSSPPGSTRTAAQATAGAGAAPGTYAVRVTALATPQKWTAGAGLAPTAAIGSAYAGTTLTLSKTGGAPTIPPIALDGTETLTTLRDRINALNTGATPSGVSAALVSVSATEQRLVLTSTATGVANGFALDDGGSGLLAQLGLDAAARAANPQLAQAAADAAFSVDGIAMTRPTNTAADVLPGVTLTLTAEGDATVTVARRPGAASEAVKAFVDAFNAVQRTVATQGRDPKSPLFNDALLRTVRGGLTSEIVRAVTPATAPGVAADLSTLASLGVSLQKDGTLAFDASKLNAALDARGGNVQALLADRMGALADYTESIARPLTGLIDRRESAIDTQNGRLTDRIADIDARLEKRRLALVAQFSKFEASLGKLKALGDQMTAQFSGLNRRSDD